MRCIALPTALILGFAASAFASGGAIEINQACATTGGCASGDTAGFPVTPTVGGRYVLTSNLTVSGSQTGVQLPDGASLDLAGFEIAGPVSCPLGSCSQTAGSGVVGGADVAVSNGRIRGFGVDGISLGVRGRVERVQISQCARHGVRASAGSRVTRSQIRDVGQSGLSFTTALFGNVASLYSQNTIGTTGAVSVDGGQPAGPNSCFDQKCGTTGNRLYYLTVNVHDGAGAASACGDGFHLASLAELSDPSALEYDNARGLVVADMGEGAPGDVPGWMTEGRFNCSNWTSSTDPNGGTAFVHRADNPPWQNVVSSLFSGTMLCSDTLRTWCVQD